VATEGPQYQTARGTIVPILHSFTSFRLRPLLLKTHPLIILHIKAAGQTSPVNACEEYLSMATTSHFYVTLFSNANRDIYEQNTHGNFTAKLGQSIHLGSTSNWDVDVCGVSCSSSPHMGEDDTAVIYCNLISPQFVGDRTVRSMRTFLFP